MNVLRCCTSALTLSLVVTPVRAATFVIEVVDGAAEGFNSMAPPDAESTAGGNTGDTLGEQRLIAFEFAAEQYASRLDSDVEIVVEASMDSLECDAGGAVLGSAGPITYFYNSDDELWYPVALANARAGYDLAPLAGDVVAFFSSNLDTPSCFGSAGWYYGLDGNVPDEDVDFLSVVLHELGHGLGITPMMDFDNGQFLGNNGAPDSYSALVFDLERGERWPEMNASERVESLTNVRNLAWDGAAVTAAASSVLAAGAPMAVASPAVPGFSGAISETNFGPTALQLSAAGELVEVTNSCFVPDDLEGKVVLMRFSSCLGIDQAEEAGAVGVLVDTGTETLPPGDLNVFVPVDVGIPTLHVASGEAAALSNALASETVSIGISAAGARVGAHGSGRVLLNATRPVSEGSSIAHWDSLARRTADLDGENRDLLMEPAGLVDGVQLDITLELLFDIGWGTSVCGDGDVSGSEVCDDGEDNSNSAPDACRTNCQLSSCGDGVTDSGEECDDGDENGSPTTPCLEDCTLTDCGDGTLDPGEECDDGEENSNRASNACRTDCTLAGCGDGVIDDGETCDDGGDNGSAASGCRSDCSIGSCGDGAIASGEQCDDGDDNSDTEANACRTSCESPRCGDGVIDDGESCDDGAANSNSTPDACRTDCGPPFCGDAVVDGPETCDDGALNGSALSPCPSTCMQAGVCGNGVVDVGEACDDGNTAPGDGCDAACQAEGPLLDNPVSTSEPMGQGGSGGASGDEPTSSDDAGAAATTSGSSGGGTGAGPVESDADPNPDDDEGTDEDDAQPQGTDAEPATDVASTDTGDANDSAEPGVPGDAGLPVSGGATPKEAGCGCSVPGRRRPPHSGWLLVALAAAAIRLRRDHTSTTATPRQG